MKLRDNNPALHKMRANGYTFLHSVRTARDLFMMRDPQGRDRTVKIHKSGAESGPHGRHRYGVSLSALESADDVVFYASGERFMIIIPTSKLLSIMADRSELARVNGDQWVVNIYFDRGGTQSLVPVGFGDSYSISNFAVSISQ